jgi:dTDP-4-dehydrorhamnose 3,5-epimerase-like enzyme
MNVSFNHTRGTLRGLHRQMPPYPEAKLVRCNGGAIVDIEVRPTSQTACRTGLPDAGQQDGSHLSGQRWLQPAWVIYRIAGTNPPCLLGAEPRR